MEKKMNPAIIACSESEKETTFFKTSRNGKRTRGLLILVGLLFLGTGSLFAGTSVKKESVWKQIGAIESRGFVNFFTTPAEVVYTFKTERKDHPKAWPATYIPRFFGNMVIRVASSVNDFIVLPWYVAAGDATPLTRHFDLPDYVWQKE